MAMLRVENISRSFGSLKVLQNVNLTVETGKRIAVIGMLRCIDTAKGRMTSRKMFSARNPIILSLPPGWIPKLYDYFGDVTAFV